MPSPRIGQHLERPPVRVIEELPVAPLELDPYLSVSAVCSYTSFSRKQLRRALGDAVDPLPSFTVRARIYVRRSEVDAWMQRRRTAAPAAHAAVQWVVEALSHQGG
jgi:predicted DNA-binding transcriptional regulator AlpA